MGKRDWTVKTLFLIALLVPASKAASQGATEPGIEVEEALPDGEAAETIARSRAQELTRERRETAKLERLAERAQTTADEKKAKAGSEIDRLTGELKAVQAQKSIAEKQQKAAEKQVEEWEGRLAAHRTALAKAEAERDATREEIQNQDIKLRRLKAESEDTVKDIAQVGRESEQLQQKLQELSTEKARAEAKLAMLKSQYQQAKVRQGKLDNQVREQKRATEAAKETTHWASQQVTSAQSPQTRSDSTVTRFSDEGMY